MLTWRDAEEEAELMQLAAYWSPEPSFDHSGIIQEIELENEKMPLRRRLATALVQIGVLIDPTAIDSLNPEEAA